MAVNLVTVTGNLETLIGATPSLGRIWFKLTRADWNGAGNIFAPEYVEVVTGPSGSFTVDLQSTDNLLNEQAYRAILKYYDPTDAKDKEFELGAFHVPSGGPWALSDLLLTGAFLPVPLDVLLLTIAAQEAAEAAQSSAEFAAQQAQEAQEAVEAFGVVAPAFTSWAVASGTIIPSTVNYIWVEGRMYRRTPSATTEFTTSGGTRWAPEYKTNDLNLPLLMMSTGQSNELGGSGVTGGDRSTINGNVYLWEQFPGGGQTTGWKRAGPGNDDWTFLTTGNHKAYHIADQLQRQTGRSVFIVAQSAGGTPLAEWLPAGGGVAGASGDIFVTLDAIMTDIRLSVVPGRTGGATFASLGVTKCELLSWWQGEADADYRFPSDTRAASKAQYLQRFRSFLRAIKFGEGTSAEIMMQEDAPVLLSGLLPGGTSGGNPTDDRNDALQELGSWDQWVKFIPSTGMGATDNLHVDGPWLVEAARRSFHALNSFPKDYWVERIVSGNDVFHKYSDGRLILENVAITTVATTTATGSVFTSAALVTWTFATGAGIPIFTQAPFITARATGASARLAPNVQAVSAVAADIRPFSSTSVPTAFNIAGRAEGFWR